MKFLPFIASDNGLNGNLERDAAFEERKLKDVDFERKMIIIYENYCCWMRKDRLYDSKGII